MMHRPRQMTYEEEELYDLVAQAHRSVNEVGMVDLAEAGPTAAGQSDLLRRASQSLIIAITKIQRHGYDAVAVRGKPSARRYIDNAEQLLSNARRRMMNDQAALEVDFALRSVKAARHDANRRMSRLRAAIWHIHAAQASMKSN
jgi:hypothetical protein